MLGSRGSVFIQNTAEFLADLQGVLGEIRDSEESIIASQGPYDPFDFHQVQGLSGSIGASGDGLDDQDIAGGFDGIDGISENILIADRWFDPYFSCRKKNFSFI